MIAQQAMYLIDKYAHSRQDKPFFLYLAFQAVHDPDEVPQSYIDAYKHKNWTDKRKIYAGMLTAADEGIANITRALQRAGLWKDTLLVFTTDNGGPTTTCAVQGSSNHPRRGGKCTVWEGGTTGDGFVSGPALYSIAGMVGNRRMTDIFHVVDWLPTLADLVGVNPKGQPLDGVSQLAGLRNEAGRPPARKEVFVGYANADGKWYGPAIRYDQWKMVQGESGGPYESNVNTTIFGGSDVPQAGGTLNATYLLFDLHVGREENHNVASTYPEIVEFLRGRLDEYQKTYVPPQASYNKACPFPGLAKNSIVGPAWYVRKTFASFLFCS